MYIDLTTIVSETNKLFKWAKSQDNPYIAMGHIGTHIDTYEKSNIPLEYFKSRGILFDVRNLEEISTKDIDIGLIKKDDFIIFRTGRIEKYSYGEDGYFDNHPQLSNELIQKLIEKEIRFIGIDCPGIKRDNEHEKIDRLCENNSIYIIENLSNIYKIDKNIFKVYTMWLDDEKMTGLKCRVIVECN